MVNRALLSATKSDESDNAKWKTPPDLFGKLREVFPFTLDAAASENNLRLPRYYTPEQNGLRQPWDAEWTWVNPPYKNIKRWTLKALEESRLDRANSVHLLPARTGAKWMQETAFPYCKAICFMDKRVQFVGAEDPAVFDSCLLVYLKEGVQLNGAQAGVLDSLGYTFYRERAYPTGKALNVGLLPYLQETARG